MFLDRGDTGDFQNILSNKRKISRDFGQDLVLEWGLKGDLLRQTLSKKKEVVLIGPVTVRGDIEGIKPPFNTEQ